MAATEDENRPEFERLSQEHREMSLVQEFWQFVNQNKKWWLIPIMSVFLLLGMLIFLSGTAAAPFIYSLF